MGSPERETKNYFEVAAAGGGFRWVSGRADGHYELFILSASTANLLFSLSEPSPYGKY